LPVRAKTVLRQLSPSTYRAAVRLRRGPVARAVRGPARVRTRRLFEQGGPVTVDVSGEMGLGGVLTNAARALFAARAMDVDVALRFTSPNYAPSWGSRDWLECYFTRLGSQPDGRPTCDAHNVPISRPPDISEWGALVWNALRIRDDIVAAADAVADGTFAAVHFRGSDKMLEARRVRAEAVLHAVEEEMRRDGIERLFVASDEPGFVQAARASFGERAFALPVEAVASADGRPPHFSSVAGETKAREALATMLILARAKLLVKTESLLSDWATTLASDQRVVRLVASRGTGVRVGPLRRYSGCRQSTGGGLGEAFLARRASRRRGGVEAISAGAPSRVSGSSE
jgi:hypothetical protein